MTTLPLLEGDDAVAAVVELLAFRELWAEGGDAGAHFYVDARGGGGTRAREGAVSGCVAVFARQHVRRWCVDFSCNRMRSFKYLEHGGERICYVLAREWHAKQTRYYEQWLEAGSVPAWDFAGALPYEESAIFYETVREIDPASRTYRRFAEVVEWFPRAVGAWGIRKSNVNHPS